MNFLGVSYGPLGHDTSAALVCDGRLVAAAEEERFTRRKHELESPLHAIAFCLEFAGLTMRDIQAIATPEKLDRTGRGSYVADLTRAQLEDMHRAGEASRRSLWHKRVLDAGLGRLRVPWPRHFGLSTFRTAIRGRFGVLPRILSYDHHECHAAAAYLTSRFERAAVATIDYSGGPYATALWRAEGNELRCLRRDLITNSLGIFYWEGTDYLGLGEYNEGKTMGLAAWGEQHVFAAQVQRMLHVGDGWYQYRQKPSPQLLGFSRRRDEPVLEGSYKDLAAALQQQLEAAIRVVVTSAMQSAGSRNLCLGGGVTLNCSANGALLAAGIADSLALFPASNDGGLAVGAALLAARDAGELQREPLLNAISVRNFLPMLAHKLCARTII